MSLPQRTGIHRPSRTWCPAGWPSSVADLPAVPRWRVPHDQQADRRRPGRECAQPPAVGSAGGRRRRRCGDRRRRHRAGAAVQPDGERRPDPPGHRLVSLRPGSNLAAGDRIRCATSRIPGRGQTSRADAGCWGEAAPTTPRALRRRCCGPRPTASPGPAPTAISPTVSGRPPSARSASTLPTGPDASSSFSSCSTIGERLVISGVLAGDTERWTVGPAGTLETTGPPEVDAPSEARGDANEPYRLNDIGTESGWYFATGRLDTAAYTGRVIWLSADGTRWTWVPVPTAEPDASLMAAADGDDLTLLSNSTQRRPGLADHGRPVGHRRQTRRLTPARPRSRAGRSPGPAAVTPGRARPRARNTVRTRNGGHPGIRDGRRTLTADYRVLALASTSSIPPTFRNACSGMLSYSPLAMASKEAMVSSIST